jgi:hypothetical protein
MVAVGLRGVYPSTLVQVAHPRINFSAIHNRIVYLHPMGLLLSRALTPRILGVKLRI